MAMRNSPDGFSAWAGIEVHSPVENCSVRPIQSGDSGVLIMKNEKKEDKDANRDPIT
jgi:hypothetical protein